ncbi:SNF2 domain-containing protein CLASSY 3-like [Iris pallida]|uniref:SNF2 domain-containing protein CLASSY 3-like n=1 Tax=Iris pallida TaxID=29817 RepID=A0AAX6GIJ4_IRIPA|nr:SNF2 domain-containing protein CLASSY 3-like [Iris pallida]KAJ6839825.1 SNF2 domain-containing protein CLASSY 3-like [Iris pallida]
MKNVDRRSRTHKTLSDVTAPAPPAGAALDFDESLEDDFYVRESLKKKKKKRKDPPTTSGSSTAAGAQPRSRSRTVGEEHRKGPREARREGTVSVSAGDDADESVRCLDSKSAAEKVSSSEHSAFRSDVRIKEERGSVGRCCGGDVPEAGVSVSEEEDGGDGDGEPTKPTNRAAGAPYRCVAGRTRALAGKKKKNRVSYGQYFNEEEEKEETEFTVLDDSKKASEKGGKGKGKVSEILVNEVESSVNVEDDKAEIARRRESGENVGAGRCKTERASRVGGESTENVGREKFEKVSRRGGELNNAKAEESETVSRRVVVEEVSDVFVKTKYGIPLIVTCEGSEKAAGYKATSKSQSSGPAGRTRSRFRSSASEKLKKLGTLSKPLCLDEDDPEANDVSGLPYSGGANLLDSDRSATMDLVLHSPDVVDMIGPRKRVEDNGSSKHADVDKRKGEGRGSKSKIRKRLQPNSGFPSFNGDEREGTGNGRVQMKLTSKRRKTARSLKDNDFFKVLKDTIWNYDKKLPEELIVESESQCETWQNLLLPIFCFEDEKPEQVEKSEYEKEIDDLWAELDLALDSNNIKTMIYQGDEAQTDEISELEMKSDPFSSCSKGKHQFILDEQIGMTCKFCSFVEVHIKDIMPPWVSNGL